MVNGFHLQVIFIIPERRAGTKKPHSSVFKPDFLPDISIRWIRDFGFPIKDKGGHVIWCAGIAIDITDTKPESASQSQAGNESSSIETKD